MGAFFPTQDVLAKPIENYVWDTNTMSWVKETQPAFSNVGNITVTSTGTVTVGSPTLPGTATLTNVPASTISVTLLAANANRLGAVIVNESTNTLYVKFGATASSSSYT